MKWISPYRIAQHYLHGLELRAHLFSELRRAKRAGISVPSTVALRTLRNPTAVEPLLALLRFVDPTERVLLIDIGANTGYWAAEFRRWFPRSSIYAFEPVRQTYAELVARFAGDSDVLTRQVGISDRTVQVAINVGAQSTMSSLHEYVAGIVQGDTAVVATELVQLDSLDNQGIATEGCKVVMKVDVQGHETEVFRGAAATLARTDVVIAELNLLPEHRNRPATFASACALLARHELYPAVFCDYGRDAGPYPVQRDVVFARASLLYRVLGW